MQGLFKGIGIKLVDFKLEFGRLNQDEKKRIAELEEDQKNKTSTTS